MRQQIIGLYKNGCGGYRITKALNSQGFKTDKGKKVTLSLVYAVLRSENLLSKKKISLDKFKELVIKSYYETQSITKTVSILRSNSNGYRIYNKLVHNILEEAGICTAISKLGKFENTRVRIERIIDIYQRILEVSPQVQADLATGVSTSHVAEDLNRLGILTKRGKHWTSVNVFICFKNIDFTKQKLDNLQCLLKIFDEIIRIMKEEYKTICGARGFDYTKLCTILNEKGYKPHTGDVITKHYIDDKTRETWTNLL